MSEPIETLEPHIEPKDDSAGPKDLWDAAYESLRKEEPKIVEAYEKFLFDDKRERNATRAPMVNISNVSGPERQRQLYQVLDSQQVVNKQKRWQFTVSQ